MSNCRSLQPLCQDTTVHFSHFEVYIAEEQKLGSPQKDTAGCTGPQKDAEGFVQSTRSGVKTRLGGHPMPRFGASRPTLIGPERVVRALIGQATEPCLFVALSACQRLCRRGTRRGLLWTLLMAARP